MSLKQQAAKGVFWTSVQGWGSNLLALAVVTVLARLLEPDDFGLVALALVFVAFAQIFQQQGFGPAIVQRAELDPEHLDSGFWINVAGGAVCTAAALALAGPLERVFDTPGLAPVLRWLSPVFLLGALTTTQQSLFHRRMDFRTLAVRRMLSTAIGGAVGVGMAFAGFGVMSLVGQQLAAAVAGVVVLWTASDWRPGRRVTRRHARDLLGFGAHVTGLNVLGFFNRRSDQLLIGTLLGSAALGLYTIGYRLVVVGIELFNQSVQTVALPTFSRLQDDVWRVRSAYYTAITMTSLLAFPAFTGLAVLAPEIIVTVFGPKWEASIPVMRILALVGILHAVACFNGPVLMAVGRPAWAFRLNVLNTVVNVGGFVLAIAMGWGITGVAAAFVVRAWVLQPLPLLMLRRLIRVDLRTWLARLAPAATGSILMAGALLAVRAPLAAALGREAALAACVLLGAALYAVVIRLLAPDRWRESTALLKLAMPGGRGGDAPPPEDGDPGAGPADEPAPVGGTR
ncbi:MAG: oligosaccharide flippase family protein [Planctomycetota bacterium]|jgi:PST family polysaccharide transporter